ncbi:MAG: tetratricopeptide repeat protein [Myxococcaceae bacterium]
MRAPRRFLLHLFGALLAIAAGSASALAQSDALELVDPDARKVREPPEELVDESDTVLPDEPFVVPKLKPRVEAKPDAGARATSTAGGADAGTEAAAASAAVAGPPKTIKLATATDQDLDAAWERFRKASGEQNALAASAARTEITKLRDDLSLSSLEAFSVGFVRASEVRQKANDAAGAIELASTAVELAPGLPQAHQGLAGAYLFADATNVGRYLGELIEALSCMVKDPRYLRPVVADVGAGLLLTLLVTATVVSLALFARRARYFFHDFHHLLPRAAARWQSAAAAALLLSVPVVMRLGAVPVLFLLVAAVAFYLSFTERLVAAVLLASLGLLPYGASFVARRAAFAGTTADDLSALERGGHGEGEVLERVQRRVAEGRAGYGELFALGRHELRRGQLEAALGHLQAAIVSRAGDARAMVNLGNAMAAKGDLEGAVVVYESAARADPSLAAAVYNLGRVLELRAASLPAATAPLEFDRAKSALANARALDPSLAGRKDPGDDLQVNRLLLSPGLTADDLGALVDSGGLPEKVRTQVGLQLLGELELPWGALYPLVLGLALLGLGGARGAVRASKVCNKCGRPVCRRCDPELGQGSEMCHQCVNVFARKGVVPPPVKVRKQIEVARYQGRMDKLAVAYGLLCSGAGHLFAGLPVRGALYAFCFSFVVVMVFLRNGVVRTPYLDPSFELRLVVLGLVFLVVYLLPLRGLYKRQAE